MSKNPSGAAAAEAFIQRWQGLTASELSSAQSFVRELCDLLGVDKPHPTPEQDYMFERPLKETHGDGSASDRRVDCYKRGHFVLESKQIKTGPHTKGYDQALLRAHAQAQNYARALPASEGRPPFLVVVDVGRVIQLFSEFSCTGGSYVPFPDPRSHQITLQDLRDDAVRQRLRLVWTDPLALDPGRANAQVTREVAAVLAQVAKGLEAAGHAADRVGAFLTRCLFCMFAEDVGLLPAPEGAGAKGAFSALLLQHREDPPALERMLKALWADMDRGGFSSALGQDVLRFNGKLFKQAQADGYALPLDRTLIDQLLAASRADWTAVEPSIFGTLLERALDPTERHALGAHYTPRACVERLVLPTVLEPLRAEWADAQAAALLLSGEAAALTDEADRLRDDIAQRQAQKKNARLDAQAQWETVDKLDAAARAKLREAVATVKAFHHRLCSVRVLDPACGSGNFLYVTLEHLKRLEAEVLNQLEALDPNLRNRRLETDTATVTLQQLRGIELNPRAAALAELVLWIGYLQWQARTVGLGNIVEPVVHDYGNIEHRDAVLAWDRQELLTDETGQPVMRWDGRTHKLHPVTGLPVPDEGAQVPQWGYLNLRKAEWPAAEFIVGNPPFIGASTMRAALGDGYVDALRSSWPEVPDSADFVMYWWHHAAQQVAGGKAERFGFITTNSIRQTFNRRVVQAALPRVSLIYAIADHPWVDSANGAAVRIAMTVVQAGGHMGRLLSVQEEKPQPDGEVEVKLAHSQGRLHEDLRIGANVAAAKPLRANTNLSNRGVQLFGAGFIVTREEAAQLGLGSTPGLEKHIREYRNGRDLTGTQRDVLVIDLFGLESEKVRTQFPAVYQWVFEQVKPERDQNNRATYRQNWWIFGEPRKVLRHQLHGLPRYIATVETAKHRVFQLLDASVLPDNKLVAIAMSDACVLGVLSSQAHAVWALAVGSRLGVGNDPVYVKSTCFETFPFPDADTSLTPALRALIGELAEQIDAHRKARQAAHPTLTLTGLYNVLDKLRAGQALTPKDRAVHEQGLVSVLRSLHDELDAAVLAAYGWQDLGAAPHALDASHSAWTDALLHRLVELNARRAAEEAAGTVRWLRPEYQRPGAQAQQARMDLGTEDTEGTQDTENAQTARTAAGAAPASTPPQPWPATLPEQIKIVANVLSQSPTPLDLDTLASRFKARGRWRDRLPTILDTLAAIGRAHALGEGRWRA